MLRGAWCASGETGNGGLKEPSTGLNEFGQGSWLVFLLLFFVCCDTPLYSYWCRCT